ncbi:MULTISPECIES: iron ABC transporter permease [Pigmentiphaga]|uniref:Iron ABC transporter permease n=1 Tax=Pigmentiphaga daeguensis TaxID=414049 RepID=A0ABN1B7W9_9BURK|nr:MULTISPECIES: iron ABC transporter permease [unclassified Pigmentiphaga]OVZ61716.1 iron ABC transporter permease [Pigmentiphaga sp. NML030171]
MHRRTALSWPAAAVAAFIALPIVSLLWSVSNADAGARDILAHLAGTVLPGYVATSLLLMAAVGAGAAVVGVATAWVVAAHDFPGRRVYEWALILPLAMPTYVMAYAFTDFFQFSGPVQTLLRDLTGQPRLPWFPAIRSWYGAALVFIFAFYPYVYLLTRTAFLERSPRLSEAARTLGCGPARAFFAVVLPLARPAAVAGITLVLMETLADYGAVSYFGVQTFTTGIYRAWLSMGDRIAAAQLASALLAFVFVLVWLERRSRTRLRFHAGAQRHEQAPRRLSGRRAVWANLVCLVPLTLGFLLPVAIMLRFAAQDFHVIDWNRYAMWLGNTLRLAATTSVLAVVLALGLAYAARLAPGRLVRAANSVAGMGYAVPGAVLAVGLLILVGALDGRLEAWGWSFQGTLTGTLTLLVYAYLVRFLAVALQTTEAGLAKITPSLDASARSLGAGTWELLARVHQPLLRRSLLTAALLVFVDVMKELPATLVLRPFNFDTLAVITDHLAADERLGEAAVPALTIVLAGLLPVIVLARAISRRDKLTKS